MTIGIIGNWPLYKCKEEMSIIGGKCQISTREESQDVKTQTITSATASYCSPPPIPPPYFWGKSYLGHLIIYLLSLEGGWASI